MAIQGEGLLDLCYAVMKFGQKHRKATRKDLEEALPTRNTVKATTTSIASEKREAITKIIKKAIVAGGIAATTDTWTDNYHHTTYICVVAHICVYENNGITYHLQ